MKERISWLAFGVLCTLVFATAQWALEARLTAQDTTKLREDEREYVRQLEFTQRPSDKSCLAAPPSANQSPIRLDAYGNLKDPFGTEGRPFYLYWDSLRIVAPDAPANVTSGVLQARIITEPPTDPVPINKSAAALMVGGLPFSREVAFERAILMSKEKGGVVKIDIEVQLDPTTKAGAPVTSLFLILEKPWTIVMNETGPVDPRFKNPPAAVYLPCHPLFRYAPTKKDLEKELAPVPIVRKALPFVGNPSNASAAFALPVKPGLPTSATFDDLITDPENHQADLIIERQGTAIAVTSLTSQAKPGFKPESPRVEDGVTVFTVSLDRTGVTSWPYLNRRRPPLLSFITDAYLEFFNTLTDRQFVVTFAGIPETSRAELVRQGLKVTDCRDAKCKAAIQVMPSGRPRVPLRALREALAKGDSGGVVSFAVSFFDDDVTPSNSAGYFTFVDEQNFREAGSTTAWSSSVTVATQRDPDLSTFVPTGQKAALINFGHPWGRINRTHVTGSATIALKQQLGARADAEVELVAKKGDFGLEASGVTPSKYFATIYALNGATLTGGRFDLAAPTNSIALSESGEAVNVAFRVPKFLWLGRINVARIVRKELPDGSFTAAEVIKATTAGTLLEKDHGATVVQFKDITLSSKIFRASLYGSLGEAKRGLAVDPANPTTSELSRYEVDYWTTGVDTTISHRHVLLTGGLYRNKRWSKDVPAAASKGIARSGYVGLGTLSYTNVDKSDRDKGLQTVDWVLSGSVGAGGDYVGESQAFAPDQLFLTTFAPALREDAIPIGPGLTNKWYYGLALSSPQSWNLIKKIIGPLSPTARDINASSVSFKVHQYLRRGGGAARALGTEGNFEFRIETPKGVRFQLLLAAFKPGEALTSSLPGGALVSKWQYSTKFGVTIRLE
jgi:hypothetical protein